MQIAQPVISRDKSYVTIPIDHSESRFHACWLRDNAIDEKTRSSTNGQRLISLLEQPAVPLLKTATLSESGELAISFDNDPADYVYPLSWLALRAYDSIPVRQPGWVQPELRLWNSELAKSLPSASYADIAKDKSALCTWLGAVEKFGFATLDNIPADQDGLLAVTALFGYVRETNYGKCFDVRSEVQPVNLAYTGLGLQAHTDNPYRDPVPTMQILACMENSAAGGDSVVVDGFNAAQQLLEESPTDFGLLSNFPARFSFRGAQGVNLHSKKPMIELGVDGELLAVRFNNRSAAPFTDIPFEKMAGFYQAYRHFAEIIERPQNKVSFKLAPQQLFIVDNTRVLHSRNAFSGEGHRWLRGCYPDRDGLYSTLEVLREQLLNEQQNS